MNVTIRRYFHINNGILVGRASVIVHDWDDTELAECTLLRKDGRHILGMPARPVTKKDPAEDGYVGRWKPLVVPTEQVLAALTRAIWEAAPFGRYAP